MSPEQVDSKRAEALRIARVIRSPISRRGLLELAGWSGLAALASGAPGCASWCGGDSSSSANKNPKDPQVASNLQPGDAAAPVTWEESVTAVEQFSFDTGITLSEQAGVHGIRLASHPKKVIEVVFLPGTKVPANMPKHFSYKYPGDQENPPVPVKPLYANVGKAHVRVGHTAKGQNLPVGQGSVGWNIRLNGTCVAVSCFHVLCTNGNNTQPGVDGVLLNGTLNAKIRCFQVLQTGQNAPANDWDLALADYNNDKDCVGYYTKCSATGPYPAWPYPMSLAPVSGSNQPVPNTTSNNSMYLYHKVGAASPICASGAHLKRTGAAVSIQLPGGAWANFRGALVFEKLTNPGDSGCVIVRDSDNAVTGLNFGGNDDLDESYSNPLYRIPWIQNDSNYLVPADPENQQASTWIPQFTVAAGNNRCC